MTTAAPAPFPDRVDRDVLARIPLVARSVLEIGHGSGGLACAWRVRAPHAVWKGIDVDPRAAEAAGPAHDRVLRADVETVTDEELDAFIGEDAPDVLVLVKVIEHWRDPGAALARLVARLRPGATVVACTANVGHWSLVETILSGGPSQPDESLSGTSSPRGFSLDDARALLAAAGLNLIKMRGREAASNAGRRDAVIEALRPALAQLGIPFEQARARLSASDYVLVARKPSFDPVLHVHHLVMVPRLMEARMDGPAEALSSLPDLSVTRTVQRMSLPDIRGEQPRILIVQRQLVVDRAGWLASMASIARRGWLIVAEWDDHPELLPTEVRERWRLNPWLPFSGVHALQVSTPLLAEALREHNPEVAVLPNALLEVPPLAARPEGGPLRIVCAAMSRPGLAGIVGPAVDATLRAHPDATIDVVADRELFDALASDRKSFHPTLPYPDYLSLLSASDISLMPIQGLAPERYKSPLKYMEGARSGAVCIGSPVLYAAVIRDGITGFLAQGPEQWREVLLRVAGDADLRRRVRLAAWEDVRRNHMQASHVGARAAWYRDLWARRADLHRALAARHPDYAGVPF
jgi:SAM-dependent methyltransferase